jgi:hypothetical protein
VRAALEAARDVDVAAALVASVLRVRAQRTRAARPGRPTRAPCRGCWRATRSPPSSRAGRRRRSGSCRARHAMVHPRHEEELRQFLAALKLPCRRAWSRSSRCTS